MDQERADYAEPDLPNGQPARGRLWAMTAGLLTFLASRAAGVGITILVVRSIPPKVAHPTEVYEGIEDYFDALFRFGLGVVLSFGAAVVVGVVVSTRIACRQAGQRPTG
jgi:hypothetical protein